MPDGNAIRWLIIPSLALVLAHGKHAHADGPVKAGGQTSTIDRSQLLIVTADALVEAAQKWQSYRREQGWAVELRVLPGDRSPDEDRDRIRNWIAEASDTLDTDASRSKLYVLLLGDADAVPSWPFDQPERVLRSRRDATYISDQPYQVGAADAFPTVALGRVPARTVDDALGVLEKIKTYEASTTGAWRKRISFVAGRGRFGAADWLLESLFKTMVRTFVPPVNDISMTYASVTSKYCPPPCCVRDEVTNRLNEGALLFNYIGHGNATALDRLHWPGGAERIFDHTDLDNVRRTDGSYPIALLTCCSSGWFDLPAGRRSLAEAMLFSPGGPIAVIAGSRMTHPYANAVFQKDVIEQLLQARSKTVGELDLCATQSLLTVDEHDRQIDALATPLRSIMQVKCSLHDMRIMHARLYNLLGDPCTRIAHMPVNCAMLDLAEDDTLTIHVPGMSRGSVLISVETDREASASSHTIDPVKGPFDADFPEKAAHNYPAANQRSFVTVSRVIIGEPIEVSLADAIPQKARYIKVYAEGVDADGEPLDCAGVLELKTPELIAPALK